MKVLVSVLCHNRSDCTREFLKSALGQTYQNDVTFLITDNASTDDTAEFLNGITDERVKVCRTQINEGFITPNNEAFDEACADGYDYFVMVNNDAIVGAGWLDSLVHVLEREPKGALCCPTGLHSELTPQGMGKMGRFEYCEGSCLAVKVALAKNHRPLFSPSIEFAYTEDSDLSLRMREAGYTIHQARIKFSHKTAQTTAKNPELKAKCEHHSRNNHALFVRKWGYYLRTKRFDQTIIVRRAGAKGDVMLTTPVLQAIRAAHPMARLFVQTECPDVLQNYPGIKFLPMRSNPPAAHRIILDMAYENTANTHYVDSYFLALRHAMPWIDRGDFRPVIHLSDKDRQFAEQNISIVTKLCVIHPGITGWGGRDWPQDRWAELVVRLKQQGWNVLAVGAQEISQPLINAKTPHLSKTTFTQLGAVIARADLFIGIDSSPLHVAQAVGTKAIGLFGMSDPKFVLQQNDMTTALYHPDAAPCCGVRHREAGKTMIQCSPDCIKSITVEDVIEAVNGKDQR